MTGAWDSVNGTGVLISVVDDGVDHQHNDLSPNYQDTIDWDYCTVTMATLHQVPMTAMVHPQQALTCRVATTTTEYPVLQWMRI